MEATKNNESIQDAWKQFENILSQSTNSAIDSYNQQLNFWNSYKNNVMNLLNNGSKNITKNPFISSNSINDLWMNWMKSFYKNSFSADTWNMDNSMQNWLNQINEYTKKSSESIQQNYKQTQTNLNAYTKLLNDASVKQSELMNQYVSLNMNSINKLNVCLNDFLKNTMTDLMNQNINTINQIQTFYTDAMKVLQKNNADDTQKAKEPEYQEMKRKPAVSVEVQ
jgi:hypothetical protein